MIEYKEIYYKWLFLDLIQLYDLYVKLGEDVPIVIGTLKQQEWKVVWRRIQKLEVNGGN